MKDNINILLVDNDPKILKSARRALKPRGYSLEGVLSGKEAILRMRQKRYDLVFVALTMPDMDGITLIKWIKQSYPAIGIVVIISDLLQEHIKEVHKLGIISLMRKPFTPEILREVTNKAIEWIRENTLESNEEEIPSSKLAELDKVIHESRKNPSHIIRILLQAQEIFGYLPSMVLKRIAQEFNRYPSEICSIVSFYPCFRTKPGGDHVPCYMGRTEKIWKDVTWKTGRRVINAVNEFIKGNN
jgi:CheY-like chemotaxis protein